MKYSELIARTHEKNTGRGSTRFSRTRGEGHTLYLDVERFNVDTVEVQLSEDEVPYFKMALIEKYFRVLRNSES